jgi:hypothetical protein
VGRASAAAIVSPNSAWKRAQYVVGFCIAPALVVRDRERRGRHWVGSIEVRENPLDHGRLRYARDHLSHPPQRRQVSIANTPL